MDKLHSALLWLKSIIVVIVAWFAPIHTLMAMTLVLVSLDLLTGIAASVKRGGWKSITSHKLAASAGKIIVYMVGLAVSHLVEKVFVIDLPIVRMLASIIGLRELLSVFENLNIASGQNLLTSLIGQLNSAKNTPKPDPNRPDSPE